MKAIYYKGQRIAPGSDAAALYERQEWKKLDAHMKALHDAAVKRGELLPEGRPQ